MMNRWKEQLTKNDQQSKWNDQLSAQAVNEMTKWKNAQLTKWPVDEKRDKMTDKKNDKFAND